jgi:hypothetical protein
VTKHECFERVEMAVRAGRRAALRIGSNPDTAERTIRTDVYIEETKTGVFRIRIWKHKIQQRALLMGVGTDECKKALKQYEEFFNG